MVPLRFKRHISCGLVCHERSSFTASRPEMYEIILLLFLCVIDSCLTFFFFQIGLVALATGSRFKARVFNVPPLLSPPKGNSSSDGVKKEPVAFIPEPDTSSIEKDKGSYIFFLFFFSFLLLSFLVSFFLCLFLSLSLSFFFCA